MTFAEEVMLLAFAAEALRLESLNPDHPSVKAEKAHLRQAVREYLAERPHLLKDIR